MHGQTNDAGDRELQRTEHQAQGYTWQVTIAGYWQVYAQTDWSHTDKAIAVALEPVQRRPP